ncbi:hypothetical protein [Inquilinus limosus]|uniref:Uncharacterized protein n=1 Tax=Inquilinus limosus MP06 TaxID=1398085 RepID=A0A0A0DGN3_9PROT|nr:hypothetical protein [Inquilinus limosus]KGM36162.1 hypothetical protein P409_00510 [Inquilinus limosus MP06]
MQHLTTAQIRAANLRAIEEGTLAAIAHPGKDGCSYIRGCAIGCALNDETRQKITNDLLDATRLVILLEEPDLLQVEDVALACRLQSVHDALARGDMIASEHAAAFPVLTPFIGEPIELDHYRAVIESLPT